MEKSDRMVSLVRPHHATMRPFSHALQPKGSDVDASCSAVEKGFLRLEACFVR